MPTRLQGGCVLPIVCMVDHLRPATNKRQHTQQLWSPPAAQAVTHLGGQEQLSLSRPLLHALAQSLTKLQGIGPLGASLGLALIDRASTCDVAVTRAAVGLRSRRTAGKQCVQVWVKSQPERLTNYVSTASHDPHLSPHAAPLLHPLQLTHPSPASAVAFPALTHTRPTNSGMTGVSARLRTAARWRPGVTPRATSPSSASTASRCGPVFSKFA